MNEKRPWGPPIALSSQKAFSLSPKRWAKARSASCSASSRLAFSTAAWSRSSPCRDPVEVRESLA